jgi:hypothetical protein
MRLVLSLPRYHHGMLRVSGRGCRGEHQIPLRKSAAGLAVLAHIVDYYDKTRRVPDVNSQARDGTHKGTAAVDS